MVYGQKHHISAFFFLHNTVKVWLWKSLEWSTCCTCGLVLCRDGGVKLEAHTPVCVGQTSPSGKKIHSLKTKKDSKWTKLKDRIQIICITFFWSENIFYFSQSSVTGGRICYFPLTYMTVIIKPQYLPDETIMLKFSPRQTLANGISYWQHHLEEI